MIDITLENTLIGHQNPIYTLAIDEQNGLLYSAGNDKGIVEWDLHTLKFKRVLCNVPSSVYKLAYITELDLLVASLRTGGLLVIRKSVPELAAKLAIVKGAAFVVEAIVSKKELIAIDEFGKAYVWSLDNFELLYSFQASTTTVRSLVLDEANYRLAIGDKNGVVHMLDIRDYHTIQSNKVHTQSVTSLAFVDGYLISGSRDAKMYKLSPNDLSILAVVTPHMFTVYGIVPLGVSSLFATVSRDKTLKVWNSDFKLQKNVSRDKGIDSHHLSINAVAYSEKQQLLCTAGDDKLVKVWKVTE
ncbi:WD40 repeat domain-containing protein [Sphingobacterium bovistauri]|uniref:WD40 repeat domain-containing protein n=1 Tax=Sphingobacterium bovistauri TaxID=2781959 RepID=A0ABS7Z1A9_9SPHI|nr:WD40 repeat domain-containing protein [Sphingobacterium bovistauri]MCA5003952.1 WD40 repeat domain-containing protein [Sphingobacterium bovistauri]